MLIRTTWEEDANVRMQVNGFNGGESFPKVPIWDWSSLKSWFVQMNGYAPGRVLGLWLIGHMLPLCYSDQPNKGKNIWTQVSRVASSCFKYGCMQLLVITWNQGIHGM